MKRIISKATIYYEVIAKYLNGTIERLSVRTHHEATELQNTLLAKSNFKEVYINRIIV